MNVLARHALTQKPSRARGNLLRAAAAFSVARVSRGYAATRTARNTVAGEMTDSATKAVVRAVVRGDVKTVRAHVNNGYDISKFKNKYKVIFPGMPAGTMPRTLIHLACAEGYGSFLLQRSDGTFVAEIREPSRKVTQNGRRRMLEELR